MRGGELFFFFFKQKTAYEIYQCDWSSDVCSSDLDMKKAKGMLEHPWIKRNKRWTSELKLMIKTGEKAELQALAKHGITFMTDTYIPQKLGEKDWI